MSEHLFGDRSIEGPRTAAELGSRFPFGDVPAFLDVLPESNREVLVLGDVVQCRELNHRQGDNPFGFLGTCGLVCCEDVLRQFGIDVTEAEVVRHALGRGLCTVTDDPAACGGTSEAWQARILSEAGIPARVETHGGLSELAEWVQEGRGIIVEVNAGELWNDANAYEHGQANHAIVVTGAGIDPRSGQLLGFYVNDSGRGYPGDSGRFVPADLMQRMWVNAGGNAVLTELMRAG